MNSQQLTHEIEVLPPEIQNQSFDFVTFSRSHAPAWEHSKTDKHSHAGAWERAKGKEWEILH